MAGSINKRRVARAGRRAIASKNDLPATEPCPKALVLYTIIIPAKVAAHESIEAKRDEKRLMSTPTITESYTSSINVASLY
jgi:hypothetical protein